MSTLTEDEAMRLADTELQAMWTEGRIRQAVREPEHGADGGVEFAAFDCADVVAGEARCEAESLLAEAVAGAQFADGAAERAVAEGVGL